MNFGSQERDFVRAADWAELQLIYSEIPWVSLEFIRTEFDIEGLNREDDDESGHDPGEAFVSQIAREFERRGACAGNGYPFKFDGLRLQLRQDVAKWNPYVFCLLVCDRDFYTSGDRSPRIFEYVSAAALESYLRGSSLRFGFPRDEENMPVNIQAALDELARLTGDRRNVGGFQVQPTDKDLSLDVVGWKDFIDERTSKVVVYMQCATGENWKSKRNDLDLNAGGWWNRIIVWAHPPLKALAIPYVIGSDDEWDRANGGLLIMDRLRICSVLSVCIQSVDESDWSEWCENRIAWVNSQHRVAPLQI